MKRKFLMAILTVALTLALIPTISAFADTDGDGILGIFTEDQNQEQEGDESADIEADEDADEDAELPKLNLKSPVLHFGPGDLGETYALTPRIGAEKVDPLLIAWTSSDTSVATVSEDGTVTVVGLGRAEITAVMLDASALPGKAKVFVLDEKKDKDKGEGDDQDEDGDKGKAGNPGKGHDKDQVRGGDDDNDEDGDSQGDDVDEDGDGDEDGDSQGDEDGDGGDQGEDGDSNPENASGDE